MAGSRESLTFELTGDADVAMSLVDAYLHSLFPDAIVTRESRKRTPPLPGVSVHLSGSSKWLFVATSPRPEPAACALQLGACAVVSLVAPWGDLERGLESLLSRDHGVFVSADVARAMAGAVNSDAEPLQARSPQVHITDREQEVLILLSRGMSNAEIAKSMHVSINTVRTYLHSLSSKFGQSGRMKLIREAAELRVVNPAATSKA